MLEESVSFVFLLGTKRTSKIPGFNLHFLLFSFISNQSENENPKKGKLTEETCSPKTCKILINQNMLISYGPAIHRKSQPMHQVQGRKRKRKSEKIKAKDRERAQAMDKRHNRQRFEGTTRP